MSYILEALKQAEEERGSDRLSGALSVPQVDVDQQKTVDWKKWLTIAIFINAIVLFVWVAWKFVSITAQNETAVETIQSDPMQDAQPEVATIQPSPLFTESEDTPLETEVPKPKISEQIPVAKPEVPDIVPADPVPSETAAVAKSEMNIPNTKTLADDHLDKKQAIAPKPQLEKPVDTPLPVKPEIDTAKVEPLPAVEPLPVVKPPEPRQEAPPVEPDNIEPAPVATAAEPEPEASAPQALENVAVVQRPPVPEFAELPYGLQQKIPEIRISVHIFNDDPQLRKVRINGRILREGEEVERNLTVDEITPHGVIFTYARTVFRLNLR